MNNSHRDPIRTGSLYHVQDVMNDSPAKDDVWCTLDILAQGDTIVLRVDDKEVVAGRSRPTGTARGTSACGASARAPSGSRATIPTASSTTRTSESSRWTEGTVQNVSQTNGQLSQQASAMLAVVRLALR